MVLKETGLEDVEWFNMAQNRDKWICLMALLLNKMFINLVMSHNFVSLGHWNM